MLIALGVPEAQHDKHIHHPDLDHTRHAVIAKSLKGHPFSPGVAGVWVSLRIAQLIAQQVRDKNSTSYGIGMENCLRDDLFQVFATMANLNPTHRPGINFGISSVSIPSFMPDACAELYTDAAVRPAWTVPSGRQEEGRYLWVADYWHKVTSWQR